LEPEVLKGRLIKDLFYAAGAGLGLGSVVGFVLGGIAQAFRPVNLAHFVLMGGGLLGTFCVALVLFGRLY
jgi:hypothetical protein